MKFKNVYMMSQSTSDDETLRTVKQSTPSRVRFAEEGPSTAQAAPVTPITPTNHNRYNSHFAVSRRPLPGLFQLRALQDLLQLPNGQPDNQGRDFEGDSRLHSYGQRR